MDGSLSNGSSSSCEDCTDSWEVRDSVELLLVLWNPTRATGATCWGRRLSPTFPCVPSTAVSLRSIALSCWSCRTLFSNLCASSCEISSLCETLTSGLTCATGCLPAFGGTSGSGKIERTGSSLTTSGWTEYCGGGDICFPWGPSVPVAVSNTPSCVVDHIWWTTFPRPGIPSDWFVAS